MQRIMTNEMVAHTWANPREENDHARGGHGNVYFEGDTIYSYGSHFPMARRVGDVILFTTDSYSSSTSKHLGYVRHAIGYQADNVFNVPNVRALGKSEHLANFESYRTRIDTAYEMASRARVHGEMHLRDAARLTVEANRYSAHFKLRRRIKEPANIEAALAEAKARADKAKRVEAKAYAAREERNRLIEIECAKRDARNVKAWRAGEYHQSLYNLPTMLRVSANGDEVQTSHGARFPVADAIKSYPLVKRCRQRKKNWQRNGEQISLGHFRLDKISDTGNVRAGCHLVPWAEIKLCAVTLGIA